MFAPRGSAMLDAARDATGLSKLEFDFFSFFAAMTNESIERKS